ncbi:MAG: sialidase family protein [Frankia sp.]
MNITGNGSIVDEGEPEIAINPANPNQMFIDGAMFPVPLVFNGKAPVPYTCGGMTSDNGGLSWQPAPLPQTVCEDGVAVFGPDGTLYAGGDVASSTKIVKAGTPGAIAVGGIGVLIQGFDPVFRSTNGGRTWSPPVKVMGSTNLGTFAFVRGSGHPSNAFDRPWLAVDQSTNTLYAAGHNIADHEGFITASTNEARSFGPLYAIDSPTYPTGGFGGNIAAGHGVVALAYTASKAPGATCPCTIFETSSDHGATFSRHVVPLVGAAKQPSPFIAADPTAKGHYALTVLDAAGKENQVYLTTDSGRSWHGPTTVGEAPANIRFKPWISYGPSGQLALMWRTQYSNGSYDVWAAIARSTDHGNAVFSAPLRVSSVAAAYPKGYGGGDDFSFVTLDRAYVHVGWGDSRDTPVGGGTQIWYARIPFGDFPAR